MSLRILDTLFALSLFANLIKLLDMLLTAHQKHLLQGSIEGIAIKFDDLRKRRSSLFALVRSDSSKHTEAEIKAQARKLMHDPLSLICGGITMVVVATLTNFLILRPLGGPIVADRLLGKVEGRYHIVPLIFSSLVIVALTEKWMGLPSRLQHIINNVALISVYACFWFIATAGVIFYAPAVRLALHGAISFENVRGSAATIFAFYFMIYFLFLSLYYVLGWASTGLFHFAGTIIWRIAEYQHGVWAALSLIFTTILGAAEVWVRFAE